WHVRQGARHRTPYAPGGAHSGIMSGSKRVLVVTRTLPPPVESRAARDYIPRWNVDDRLYSADDLIAAAVGADGLLITPQDRLPADTLSRLSRTVRAIATFSVGFDHI